MTYRLAAHHPGCTATCEWVGPFPVVTTKHHPECPTPHVDKETRKR